MRKVVLAVVLVLMASGAQAATLNVVNGQLMGASNVLVDGSLYDVQFLDGTCIDLFNGCDEVSDFTFQTWADALLASQALLDQVFLDGVDGLFDSDPSLTNGCSGPSAEFGNCNTWTPYGFYVPSGYVSFSISGNFYPSAVDGLYGSPDEDNANRIARPTDVLAVWSASVVPEPSTALLLGLGLTGLAGKGRRRSRS